MANIYIVRELGGISCFYHRDGAIHVREYKNGAWREPVTAAEGVGETYTLNASRDGKIHIFGRNSAGDILLTSRSDSQFKSQTILRGQTVSPEALFCADTDRDGMYLLYNLPPESGGDRSLFLRSMDRNGQWKTGLFIDNYVPMQDTLFKLQGIAPGHRLLFYQRRESENTLGYRELYQNRAGGFNTLYETGYQISGCSFLSSTDDLHALFIIKSMFSCRLIYRKKTELGLSAPLLVKEGQRLEKCLLYIIGSTLCASYVSNGQMYTCVSPDMGESFHKPARYDKKLCENPGIAEYIDISGGSGELRCREIYTDPTNPWSIQLIPSLCGSFYSFQDAGNSRPATKAAPAPAQRSALDAPPDTPEAIDAGTPPLDEFEEKFQRKYEDLKEERDEWRRLCREQADEIKRLRKLSDTDA